MEQLRVFVCVCVCVWGLAWLQRGDPLAAAAFRDKDVASINQKIKYLQRRNGAALATHCTDSSRWCSTK